MSVPPWFPWLVPDDPFPWDAQKRSSPSLCPIVVRGAEESTASRFLISPAESAPAGPPPATSASDCPSGGTIIPRAAPRLVRIQQAAPARVENVQSGGTAWRTRESAATT